MNDVVSGAFAETQTKTTKSGSTLRTENETTILGGYSGTTVNESESTSSQTMAYSNASQSGSVDGGSSTS